MELRNYPLEFVERTIDLIEKLSASAKQEGLDATFLLNCTLGLIVATSENLESCGGDYFKKRIAELDQNNSFPQKIAYINFSSDFKSFRNEINKKSLVTQLNNSFEISTTININKYEQARNLTLKEFLKKIRNGVAHQNIMPINLDQQWKGVRIWNKNREGIKDFEVEFKLSELKSFSIFLAQQYVNEFKNK
jgi:hypothetical protein